MKIRYTSIAIMLFCLMILSIPYLKASTNNVITIIFEVLLVLILSYYNRIKASIKQNYILLIYIFAMVVCTYINCGFSSRTITAIVTGIEYFILFAVSYTISERIGFSKFCSILFKTLLIVIIIIDSCIWITKGNGIGGSGVLPYYIFGNKFRVSYIHMLFSALFIMQNDKRKSEHKIRKTIKPLAMLLYSAYVCHVVDCNTGTIGCLIILLLFFLFNNNEIILKKMNSWPVYLTVFFGATFLLVGTDVLLSNTIVQNFVVNVLHRKLTLTGRLEMYEIALNAFRNRKLFGYGINSNAVEVALNWGNAQNGILKILLDYGLAGMFSFTLLHISVFRKKKAAEQNIREIAPLVYFLYAMAICSMVEVNLAGWYYMGLSLVNAYNHMNITDVINE